MFRATMCPSSGEITVSMRRWYLSLCMGGIWCAGWSFTPIITPDATHTEWQIPASHRYSNFSWWWAHGCRKHVEKRNKYTKQNCAPSWIYFQDGARMHGQQNIQFYLVNISSRFWSVIFGCVIFYVLLYLVRQGYSQLLGPVWGTQHINVLTYPREETELASGRKSFSYSLKTKWTQSKERTVLLISQAIVKAP